MLVSAPSGQVVFCNAAARALLGYDETADLLGTPLMSYVAPEDLDERPLDASRLTTGTPVENERLMLRGDGSRVWVKTITQRMPDGHLLFWLHDLTERYRLENQLREVQKLETAGLLAAGLAHDLNNLLMVVTGHTELLRLEHQDESTLRSVDCIATATDRAAELTRKLLAFGRKQVMRPRVVDLNELVLKNRELIRSMAGERVELSIELKPGLDPVELDPTHLEQALWNLVSNACQAMQGGGRLTIRTANVELDAQAREALSRPRPDPRFVAIAVEDTGPGIREDTLRRVFDPFFTTKKTGSGLGLSVVHGVVGQSGGLVRVRNGAGGGACFELCFPRSDARVTAQEAPPVVVQPEKPVTGTVVLVEDEPQVRAWLEQALARRGFDVHAASDGEHALALLAQLREAPLAIVTDVSMPRLSGPELVERMRRYWPLVPVVFITGYAREDAFRSLPPGCELLIKPFTLAALVARLEAVCAQHTSGLETRH
jgi:two-component system cell cycle sensor histidine kinase/response regulator CckA